MEFHRICARIPVRKRSRWIVHYWIKTAFTQPCYGMDQGRPNRVSPYSVGFVSLLGPFKFG